LCIEESLTFRRWHYTHWGISTIHEDKYRRAEYLVTNLDHKYYIGTIHPDG
jgi:hypothetical protein